MARKGFTLMEILVTIVIVGILASLGFVNFRKTLERGYFREAQDLLLTIYYGEQAFFSANRSFVVPGDWRTIFMENPNIGSIPVTFSVTAAGSGAGATFTATATRDGGPCGGRTLQIGQDRLFTPPIPPTQCWCSAC